LHVEGRHDCDRLQRHREDEDLRERALQADHGTEKVAQAQAPPVVRGTELGCWRHLERDAGEMLRDFA